MSVLLTLTIVETNRRTRAAMCSRMIPRSRSSILADGLDRSEERREPLSASECACVRVSVDVSSVGHGCVAAARSDRTETLRSSGDYNSVFTSVDNFNDST